MPPNGPAEGPEFSGDDLQQLARGFQESRILLTAYELGVFTALGEGGRSSAAVAAELGTDRRATDRLLNALVALGLLTKDNDTFANTDAAARYLVAGRPAYLANFAHYVNMWETWGTLTAAVRAGTSVFERPGGEEGARRTEAFIAAMHYLARARAEKLVGMLPLEGVARVLDVGAGSAAYAMAFVRARAGITAVAFDLPDVVPLTRRYIEAEGLSARVAVVAGDAHAGELPRGFDVVLLSQLLHSNSAAENEALIANAAASLNAGGRLVVQEFIVDEDRTAPAWAALFALNMLVATAAGDTYTEARVRGWMTAAGLGGVARTDTDFGTTVITGVKG